VASFGASGIGFVRRKEQWFCSARELGFVWRFTQLTNGFVRRDDS
jgi:hypothetical protein